MYRRQLWPFSNDSIDLNAQPIPFASGGETPPSASPAVLPARRRDPLVTIDATSETIAPELLEDFVDEGQAALLALPSQARVLVDAPPGTGKTHVACQRVAALIR